MLPVLLLLAIGSAAGIWLWLHRERRDRLWMWAWLVPIIALFALVLLVAIDLYLQKVVATLLMPTGLCWILLIALTIIAAVAKHWRSAGLIGVALLLYTATGNTWLGAALIARLEAQVLPGPDLTQMEPLTAVFVLGGSTSLTPDGTAQISDGGDRVVKAAAIFLSGKTTLLVTGGQSVGGRSLGVETRTLWSSLKIPASAVLIEPEPRITREEIELYHAMSVKQDWKRVAVLSSAWHLPRALDHCRRLGWEVVAIPSDARSRPVPCEFLWLIPQQRGFSLVEVACWEMLGRLVGR